MAELRAVLAPSGWLERTAVLARALRRSRTPGGLLVVGTPGDEPWHLTAHLAEESRLSDAPGLSPTLVRWTAPPDAPPHLRVTMRRLEQAERGETVLVVGTGLAPAPLLERVSDARKRATVLALDQGDPELEQLAHEVAHGRARDRPGVLRRGAASGQLGGGRSGRADPARAPALAQPGARHRERSGPRPPRHVTGLPPPAPGIFPA